MSLVAAAASCAAEPEANVAGANAANTEGNRLEKVYTVSAKSSTLDFSNRRIDGFKMFSRGPLSAAGLEKMPFVLFRVLPELAIAIDGKPTFGTPDKAFAPFGFFYDERKGQTDWPVPVGFTFTVQPPGAASGVSHVIRTCTSCHVSRVRMGAKITYLDGGPNTEMDFHAFTAAWTDFVHRAFDPGKRASTKERALALVKSKSPDWFFNGQSSFAADGTEVVFDAKRAQAQIDMFIEQFDTLAEDVYRTNELLLGVRRGMAEGFHRAPTDESKKQSADVGPAGILDSNSNGIYSIVNAYNLANPTKPFPVDTLYKGATKVSIPSLWEQDRRTAGQWTANVTDIYFRNSIAAMGFASGSSDLNGLAVSVVSQYVRDLRAPAFPGEVDAKLAEEGKAVYEKAKCASCHVADHRTLEGFPRVFKMGTSPNRSKSSTPGVGALVIGALWQTCAANEGNRTLSVTIDGHQSSPCKIDPRTIALPRDTDESTGYPAMPLDGVWARAPYLHNGSVPTLYHLLASSGGRSERPATFATGDIDFDAKHVGFAWNARNRGPGNLYDTSRDGFSNRGHEGAGKDGMWTDPATNERFKLSWDVTDAADRAALFALLEYMKTM